MQRKNSTFNLTKQVASLSFVCILVIALVSSFMLSRLITNKLLIRDATLSQDFVDSIIATEGTRQLFLDTKNHTRPNDTIDRNCDLEGFFFQVARMPDVVRTNVYGTDRSVLWSSDKTIIGERFGVNEELDEALKGELVFESGVIGRDNKEEHTEFDKKLQSLRFIETYIPVWNRDHSLVIGAVELYRLPRMLHQSIIESRRFIWIGTLVGGLLLFLSLYWIVKRASLVMENQQRRLLEAKSLSMIGETASAITHAMRNPLASIRACAELSLTDDLAGVRESAMDIIGETDRLDRWAREFLLFSVTNIETPECLDMNHLIKAVVKEHKPILNRSAISLQLHMAEAKLPIEANCTPISQVFGNLIMNAVEAMGEHGELTITTSLDAKQKNVLVIFVDNGPGISEEIKGKLFQPFVTTKPTGTGLGLALSRHLVEHYDGTLAISSEPEQGVTVTVCMPVSGDLS